MLRQVNEEVVHGEETTEMAIPMETETQTAIEILMVAVVPEAVVLATDEMEVSMVNEYVLSIIVTQ